MFARFASARADAKTNPHGEGSVLAFVREVDLRLCNALDKRDYRSDRTWSFFGSTRALTKRANMREHPQGVAN